MASFFFFQAEDGIRDVAVTGVQTCALPICPRGRGGAYNDDVRIEAHTFGSHGRKPLTTTVRGKVVDGDGPLIHIAKIAQAVEESVEPWRLRLKRIRTE